MEKHTGRRCPPVSRSFDQAISRTRQTIPGRRFLGRSPVPLSFRPCRTPVAPARGDLRPGRAIMFRRTGAI